MATDRRNESPTDASPVVDGSAKSAAKLAKAQARAAASEAKAAAKASATVTKSQSKATAKQLAREQRAANKATTLDRKSSKAARKASKAATKASEAAATEAATKPARAIDKVTDPKTAKRMVAVGKALAPALAPLALRAVAGTRNFLDLRRAHKLGVSPAEVAQFRGPTGETGARISGFTHALDDLAGRKGNDLTATRFVDKARDRIRDLTAATQASAAMPKPARKRVLRSVGRELDDLNADLLTHLDVK